MKYKAAAFVCTFAAVMVLAISCGKTSEPAPDAEPSEEQLLEEETVQSNDHSGKGIKAIILGSEVMELENGLSAVRFDGDYGFEEYLAQGGASSDSDVVIYLMEYLSGKTDPFSFGGNLFGCSTISVQSENGEWMFGRNFDWERCNAMIVKSVPEHGYASISTVNTDFTQGISFPELPGEAQAVIALYAPLDGMNEKGLAVSVNMIQDGTTIAQNTDKSDITTTTAVRLLLNHAADTEEAIALLKEYDMHASMNYMVHFAIADADGNSVAVEYVDQEMVVTKTPVVTNFYLSEGKVNGIGTAQSHTRYEILTESLRRSKTMSAEEVRDALSSVSKRNFEEFESTEWSTVFNQTTGEVWYYHRENYETGYGFNVDRNEQAAS